MTSKKNKSYYKEIECKIFFKKNTNFTLFYYKFPALEMLFNGYIFLRIAQNGLDILSILNNAWL